MNRYLNENAPAPVSPSDASKVDAIIKALSTDKAAQADLMKFYQEKKKTGKTNKEVDKLITQATGGKLKEIGDAGFADPTITYYGTMVLAALPLALGGAAFFDWWNNRRKAKKANNQTPTQNESAALAEVKQEIADLKQELNEIKSVTRFQKLANIK